MANFSGGHDVFRILTNSDGSGRTQSASVTSTTTISTTAFDVQTRAVSVLAQGNVSSTSTIFIRFYNVGQNSAVASTIDAPVPINWVQTFKVTPGQRAAITGGDSTGAQRVYVTELTD